MKPTIAAKLYLLVTVVLISFICVGILSYSGTTRLDSSDSRQPARVAQILRHKAQVANLGRNGRTVSNENTSDGYQQIQLEGCPVPNLV